MSAELDKSKNAHSAAQADLIAKAMHLLRVLVTECLTQDQLLELVKANPQLQPAFDGYLNALDKCTASLKDLNYIHSLTTLVWNALTKSAESKTEYKPYPEVAP